MDGCWLQGKNEVFVADAQHCTDGQLVRSQPYVGHDLGSHQPCSPLWKMLWEQRVSYLETEWEKGLRERLGAKLCLANIY